MSEQDPGRRREIKPEQSLGHSLGSEENMQVYQYTKYIDPAARIHDFKPLPEGLSGDEYLEYANVDVQEHCFARNERSPG